MKIEAAPGAAFLLPVSLQCRPGATALPLVHFAYNIPLPQPWRQ